eukprot:gene18406-biopygen2415
MYECAGKVRGMRFTTPPRGSAPAKLCPARGRQPVGKALAAGELRESSQFLGGHNQKALQNSGACFPLTRHPNELGVESGRKTANPDVCTVDDTAAPAKCGGSCICSQDASPGLRVALIAHTRTATSATATGRNGSGRNGSREKRQREKRQHGETATGGNGSREERPQGETAEDASGT